MNDHISRSTLISALNDISRTYEANSFVRDVMEYVVELVKGLPAVDKDSEK